MPVKRRAAVLSPLPQPNPKGYAPLSQQTRINGRRLPRRSRTDVQSQIGGVGALVNARKSGAQPKILTVLSAVSRRFARSAAVDDPSGGLEGCFNI
jgi:hypothetical protein